MTAGNNRPTNIEIMAITVSNSTSVNPVREKLCFILELARSQISTSVGEFIISESTFPGNNFPSEKRLLRMPTGGVAATRRKSILAEKRDS